MLTHKDYDDAVAEVEAKPYPFTFGGKEFTVDLNIDGGLVLEFLSGSKDQAAIVGFIQHLFGEDQFDQLKKMRQPWAKYEMLLTDIMELMAGRGNGSSPPPAT